MQKPELYWFVYFFFILVKMRNLASHMISDKEPGVADKT